MKSIYFISLLSLVLASSCSSSKKTTSDDKAKVVKEEVVTMPCEEEQMKMQEDYIVGLSTVEGSDEGVIRKNAELRADAILAQRIKKTADFVADEFSRKFTGETVKQEASKFRSLDVLYGSQSLSNSVVLCSKWIKQTQDGKTTFKYYLLKGVSKDNLLNNIATDIESTISKEEIGLEFDRKKFLEEYQNEIKSFKAN